MSIHNPYLYGADIYTAVNEIIADLYLGMFIEDFAGYLGNLFGWVSSNRFIMQTLRGLRIQYKHRRFTL